MTVPVSSGTDAFRGCKTFVDVLAEILADQENKAGVRGLRLNLDWPGAEIELANGQVVVFGSPDKAILDGFNVCQVFRSVHFRPGSLQQLAHDFCSDVETRWSP